eukprot:TRINITY_DN22457_c0_g1_i2.p1 TRINITY_DN22457_c0_g1~~TRINITY_DN22457_c0_g1_i2.p1  ORF type:complete len:543 (-),score=82.48 TRINITY_DN22457_c0_g1_i2:18-1469(-)
MGERLAGVIARDGDKYGYLQQDNGDPDLFVLPKHCESGIIPAKGTRVTYSVGMDPQKGRPMAEHVQPEFQASFPRSAKRSAAAAFPQAGAMPSSFHGSGSGLLSGTISRDGDKFGYLQQDSGEPDLFVLPKACAMGVIPPKGTPVLYSIGVDPKKGRPLAENVQEAQSRQPYSRPEAFSASQTFSRPTKRMAVALPAVPAQAPVDFYEGSGGLLSGVISRDGDRFGYLQQDNGEPDIFVLPKSCAGGLIPPKGTRVVYTLGLDPRKGLPQAENVQAFSPANSPNRAAAPAARAPPFARATAWLPPQQSYGFATGTISRDGDKFGYLTQDSGEPDLFVLPGECAGHVIPPRGTRVRYIPGVDPNKGRPLATQVEPDYPMMPAHSSMPPQGFAESGGTYGRRLSPGLQQHNSSFAADAGLSSGTITRDGDKFGYVQQDSGGPDLFVMPSSCVDGAIPAKGTRVMFNVGMDPKKGLPMAENVMFAY